MMNIIIMKQDSRIALSIKVFDEKISKVGKNKSCQPKIKVQKLVEFFFRTIHIPTFETDAKYFSITLLNFRKMQSSTKLKKFSDHYTLKLRV